MNVLHIMGPIHTFFQISNLTQLTIDRKTKTLRPSLLLAVYTMAVVASSVALIIYGFCHDHDSNNASDIGRTIEFIQTMGIRIAHVVSITESFAHRKKVKIFFEQVNEIDRVFECSLNVEVNNRTLRRALLCRCAVMLSIYLSVEAIVFTIRLLDTNNHFSIFWLFYLVPFLVCGLRYIQILSAILIVKERFDKLIDVLNEINLLHSKSQIADHLPDSIKLISNSIPIFETAAYRNQHRDMENPDMKRLFVVRDIYNRLWELTGMLNRCFGISMLINLGNDLLSITTNCYWIFLNFKGNSTTMANILPVVTNAMWCVPHLFNVLALALMCEHTTQRTTAIAWGLHRIETNIWNDNHNTVIEQFSLQLLHQKLSFSAAGFFDVNCSLLYTIAGAITTYLIILIQFHMGEQKLTTDDGLETRF